MRGVVLSVVFVLRILGLVGGAGCGFQPVVCLVAVKFGYVEISACRPLAGGHVTDTSTHEYESTPPIRKTTN